MFGTSSLKCKIYFLGFLLLIPFTIIFIIFGPNLSTEQSLIQKLTEYQMKIQYLESLYRARQEDLSILTHLLGTIQSTSGNPLSNMSNSFSENNTFYLTLSSDTRAALKNISNNIKNSEKLKLPNAYNFLPHLLDDPTSLKPLVHISAGRTGVNTVLGVPTVKRDKQSYLSGTLTSLIDNMSAEERNDSLIIVFIGDADSFYVNSLTKDIETQFARSVQDGLIDIIAPHPSYYPDFNKLQLTFNDPLERVIWRSKQNLDYAYLMTYGQTKGTFYVQLEDDILAKRGYIAAMKKFAIEKTAVNSNWIVLDFCQLGFIGKMFKTADLPKIIIFFQMFYNDKPVDWLLESLIDTKVCSMEKNLQNCKPEKAKYWCHYRPSLFQHIGTTSSLKGKIQKLKDKQFGKVPAYFPHKSNPPANVITSIAHYKNYNIQKAYNGDSFFWGLLPQPGDNIEIKFRQPTLVRKYYFKSGNNEHPSDKFYNTTIEVFPHSIDKINTDRLNATMDGFFIIGNFNAVGVAVGKVPETIGKITILRLVVHSDTENWVLLSEISVR